MKKVFLPMVAVTMLFAACNNEKKSDSTAGTDSTGAKPSVTMPFTANYSSSFEMGNPAYAAMIEQGSWKDWQDNTMDNMKSWVADTIVAYQSDNAMVKGVDSLTARWKRGRTMYTSVKDTIDAAMAVYSTDKKENWVLVWATEINTDTKGVTDTIPIMETWRINKDGKADLLFQFDRHTRKK
jgi:hypothetical protein